MQKIGSKTKLPHFLAKSTQLSRMSRGTNRLLVKKGREIAAAEFTAAAVIKR
jgi:hypothetical protein